MKKVLLLLSAILMFSVYAQEAQMREDSLMPMPKILREYWITVKEQSDDSFSLHAKTTKEHSSMCPLIISKMEIKKGIQDQVGFIHLDIIRDPESICLMAFGHCQGSFTFSRGRNLPTIPNGSYDLKINGHAYGRLIANEEGIRLLILKDVIPKPPFPYPGPPVLKGESMNDEFIDSEWIDEEDFE